MNTVVDVHLEAEEIHMLANLLYEEWEKGARPLREDCGRQASRRSAR